MSRTDLHRRVGDFVYPIETVIHNDHSVEEALAEIRRHSLEEKIFYFYVLDKDQKLKGVVSTRNLLLSPLTQQVCEIVETHVVSISNEQSLQDAVELLSRHRLLALPVVDKENRFLGIIDIQLYLDEAIDLGKARRSSTDLFQVLGLTVEEGKTRSLWGTYKIRMPWIFCNMFGGISCAVISRVFEVVLLEVILLAMFIPLVLSLSESISMQSMTYSLQLTHRAKISGRRILKRLTDEWKMGLLLALTSSFVIGALSLCWRQGMNPALVIGAGILISVTLSALAGAAIPLILHSRKLDPKVAAGPVVLMFVDILSTAIYLGIGTLWLL